MASSPRNNFGWYHYGDVFKTAVYSSGIAAATIGYLHHFRNASRLEQLSKDCTKYNRKYIAVSVQEPTSFALYTVFYPLLLQYPSSLEMYSLLTTYSNTNRQQSENARNPIFPYLLSSAVICNLFIPWLHAQLYFKSGEQYMTQHLFNCLFDKSHRKWVSQTSFRITVALSLCEFSNLLISPALRQSPNYQATTEQPPDAALPYVSKPFVFLFGFLSFELADVVKSFLFINRFNPPLIGEDSFQVEKMQKNYYMNVLFDVDQCVIGGDCASLCIEYAYGCGFMTFSDAQRALSTILFEMIAPFMTKGVWSEYVRAKKENRQSTLKSNISSDLKAKIDGSVITKLSEIVLKLQFDKTLQEQQKNVMRKDLANEYVKRRMSQDGIARYNQAYCLLMALCRTPQMWVQHAVHQYFEAKRKK